MRQHDPMAIDCPNRDMVGLPRLTLSRPPHMPSKPDTWRWPCFLLPRLIHSLLGASLSNVWTIAYLVSMPLIDDQKRVGEQQLAKWRPESLRGVRLFVERTFMMVCLYRQSRCHFTILIGPVSFLVRFPAHSEFTLVLRTPAEELRCMSPSHLHPMFTHSLFIIQSPRGYITTAQLHTFLDNVFLVFVVAFNGYLHMSSIVSSGECQM